jgi:hypothetical protein
MDPGVPYAVAATATSAKPAVADHTTTFTGAPDTNASMLSMS